jgi:hypothetical protein
MRLALLAGVTLAAGAFAHGVHASLATANYGGKSLEITLVFSADDIETLLRQETGKHIEVDRGAEKLVFAYLERCIELKTARGVAVKLTWVGLESSAQKVTAYLEAKLAPEDLNGLRIRNDLLLDLLPDQVNMMSVRKDKARPSDHLFRTRGEWQTVRVP